MQPYAHIWWSWWNEKGNILIHRGVQVRIEHSRLNLLCVIHVFSIFPPHIRHVRGVSVCLTLQKGVMGYIDGEASRRDDNDGRTWREEELKASHVHIPRSRNIKTLNLFAFEVSMGHLFCNPPQGGVSKTEEETSLMCRIWQARDHMIATAAILTQFSGF